MDIRTQQVTPDVFQPFGKVVKLGHRTPTAEGLTFKFWSDLANYLVEGETEIGVCTVYRQPESTVGWMERHHRTPEILIPVDGSFILPVMEGHEKQGRVEAFEVGQGEAVVIGTGVWHSACIPVGRESATYFVIFRRGTPAEDVDKTDIPLVTVR